jgi:histidinol-phosphate aminotransferase
MPVSRRSFLTTMGAGSAGLVAAPLINWRGHEALFGQQQQPVSPADRRADRLLASRPGMIRIDSNENPNGPGQHVFDVITKHLGESNRYPTKTEIDLVDTIAKKQGVSAANVVLGCGSGELLRGAVFALTTSSAGLVAPEPTFEAPGAFAKFLNRPIVSPRVDSQLKLDLDAMVDAAKGAGLVYLCNPNNPTATVHGKSDIASYVERVNRASPDTTILIDEAYHEYVDDPSYASAIPLAMDNPRVLVTRTFSKVFGMAGLRAGYAIARPETLAKIQPWLLGSNTNQLVLVAAAATLVDSTHIAEEQRKNRAARAFTRKFFEHAGYTVAATDANFLMVDIRRDPKAFKTECITHDVAIGRAFPALPTHARVSIGTMPEMKKAVAVFHTVLSAPPAATSQQR